MLQIVRDLLVLQDRDQRIRTLDKDLKNIPNLQLHAKARLEGDTAALAKAQGKSRDTELKIKSLQLDAQTRRTTILRLKDQQFATRKNEEFRALAHEVERYEKDVSGIEDQELELMEVLESYKPEVMEAQKSLAATQKNVDEELLELDERSTALQTRLAELRKERIELIKPIDTTTLSLYDRMMKNKNGTAVVMVSGGICGGCHMRLVSGTVQQLRENKALTQCEQCGRILYQEGDLVD